MLKRKDGITLENVAFDFWSLFQWKIYDPKIGINMRLKHF